MIKFLKLIRFQNLLIIAFTQYAMRYGIIYPYLKVSNLFEFQLTHFQFLLVVLSTVFIAAAGYIINDYFDNKIDYINKPDEVIVGKFVKRRWAMVFHTIFNIAGIGLGFYMGVKVGVYKLGIVHMLVAGLLWYYSTDFKKRLLVGNVVIALLTALVPLLVALYELPPLVREYSSVLEQMNVNFNMIFYIIAGFSGFAFVTTLAREIIKDIEDLKGDREFGRNTLPIARGVSFSKRFVVVLLLVTIAALVPLQQLQLAAADRVSFFYILLLVELPLVILIVMLLRAKTEKQFGTATRVLKGIMLTGILYAGLFAFLFFNAPTNEQQPEPEPQIQINGGF